MKAIRYEQYHAVELLLQLGADPNKYAKHCREPLCWAIAMRRPDIYDLLLRYGAIEDRDVEWYRRQVELNDRWDFNPGSMFNDGNSVQLVVVTTKD